MRFLIITDLHHFTDIEAELFQKQEYDKCVLLGDINERCLEIISGKVNTSIYGIYGNHDEAGSFEKFGIKDLHLRGNLIGNENGGIRIAGFQGSSKYKNNCFAMYTQKDAKNLFNRVKQADILFAHDSPYCFYNKNDPAHCGLKVISKYIKKHKPNYVIHGHHHVNECRNFKKTKVICVYRCAVFDYKTGNVSVIF